MSLGLDHALVAVRDLAAARATYQALGFLSRGLSQHPWGTATMVLIFRDQLFEVVAIGDPALLDGYEAGGFRFGRHVERYLAEAEGVALTALNSADAEADEHALAARGIAVTGTIDFGRDVQRADGTPDRTRTRLKVIENREHPRLSLFACQQFRRDLIEYPEWMEHPNGATGIAALTIVAGPEDRAAVIAHLAAVHGTTPREEGADTRIDTARGSWRVTDPQGFATRYGRAPALRADQGPAICAIDLACSDMARAAELADAAGLPARKNSDALVLPYPEKLGGIVLAYVGA